MMALVRPNLFFTLQIRLLLLAVAALGLAGCQTGNGNKPVAPTASIFYPPAPEEPRLQFLTSISSENDLGVQGDRFAEFITGVTAPAAQAILKPYGAVLADGKIFVCDTGTRCVDIVDFAQKKIRLFAPRGMGKIGTPINIAVDADGTRYVTDTGRNLILVFAADETYRGAIGDGEHLRPTGVALAANRVYVTDLTGHCVRVYDKATRKQLSTIPANPDADADSEPGKLFMPVNLAIDPQGKIYVSDMGACQVKIYDAEGKHLHTVGGQGDLPGQFVRPKGIAVDHDGRFYVVDAAAQVCQIFDAAGKLLLFFGENDGSPTPLAMPAAVSVDYDNLALFQKYAAPDFVLEYVVLISNQYGDRKIDVYGFGHKK
ncbi:MAG: 6-bladed beta-propeller [Verrucomicrobia bacterium]|nr:6-bladed beta-propeller [Verrucomicrobiota bacterium]